MNVKKRNKNIRRSKYSNAQLLTMDILDVYKLVLRGDVTRFPPGTWERPEAVENSIKCTQFLIENILNWSLEDLKKQIRMKTFTKYKLGGMLQALYNNSPYEILSKVYPNKFMPWELHEAPKAIWLDKNNRLMAMDWLINKKLKWTREDIINKYNNNVLVENDLGGLLSEGGNGSSFALLNEFMEGEFYPWEFKSSSPSINYWANRENRIFALKRLFNDILKWDKEDIKKKLTLSTFKEHDLYGLVSCYYNSSPYKVVQELYPGEFYPWELSNVPVGFWESKENRVAAVKWLFEKKLNWSIDDIKKKVSQKVFKEYDLSSLIMKGSLYTLISEAYPNQLKEWELPSLGNHYWHLKENRIKALDYLFKEKLNWSLDDIKKNISQKLLIENGLQSLLSYYNGSPYTLLKEYFPNEDIKAWELQNTPNGFWQDDNNCIDAMKWLIKKLNLNLDNVDKIRKTTLIEHKLQGILFYKYNRSFTEFKKDLISYLSKQKKSV